jgi:plasmid stabilization system protein ParE
MRAIFHPEADDDFIRGLRHYAANQPELGQRFYRHIGELLAEIEDHPALFRIYRPPHARRHFRRPFPYAVVYVLKPDYIWVLAVMHFKQPPSYWLHRLDN